MMDTMLCPKFEINLGPIQWMNNWYLHCAKCS